MWEERGLNSMSVLSYLAVAAHVSGRDRYRRAARELVEKHSYDANTLFPKNQIGPASGNQSDDEMAFMNFYNLIRYETDPRLRSMYAFAFHRYWQLEPLSETRCSTFSTLQLAEGCDGKTPSTTSSYVPLVVLGVPKRSTPSSVSLSISSTGDSITRTVSTSFACRRCCDRE